MKFIKAAILGLCLTSALTTEAQSTFEKAIIDVPGRNLPTAVIEYDDGYLICAWGNEPNVGGWKAIRLFKTDSVGNVVWQKYIGKENFGYSPGEDGSFHQLGDSSFILGGRVINSNETISKFLLVKFDPNVDTLWSKQYGPNNAYSDANMARQTPDGGFVLFGLTNKYDGANDYYLIKTDSAGTFEWEKKYGQASLYEAGESIEITSDGGLILGGQKGANSVDNADGYFIKTDSAGNIQWEKIIGTQGDDRIRTIALTTDRGYLIWGGADTIISNTETAWAEFIAKLDSAGNILWRTFLDKKKYHNIWQVRELEDGSIVFIGEMVYQENVDDAGWIGKLDKNGNVLWERFHIYPQKKYFLEEAIFAGDFKQTQDGGFIVTGNIWRQQDTTQPSTYTQHIWLVKLDSLGCLNGDCGISVGIKEPPQINNEAQVVVYPNPVSIQALISIKANSATFANKEIQFHLFDISGKLLQTASYMLNQYGYCEFYVHRNQYPAGIYFYSVTTQEIELGKGKLVFK